MCPGAADSLRYAASSAPDAETKHVPPDDVCTVSTSPDSRTTNRSTTSTVASAATVRLQNLYVVPLRWMPHTTSRAPAEDAYMVRHLTIVRVEAGHVYAVVTADVDGSSSASWLVRTGTRTSSERLP